MKERGEIICIEMDSVFEFNYKVMSEVVDVIALKRAQLVSGCVILEKLVDSYAMEIS